MTSRRLLYAALAAVLIAGFFLTQFRIRPDERPIGKPEEIARLAQRDDLNVVFLLIDTLRADRLGAYGYERPTSPTIDQLAKTGIRFANHLSQSSWTKTSMASIWTAMYPNRTGIFRFDHAIPTDAVLPAEILQDAGFRTAGIWRNGWVAPTFGFEQGFEVYHRPEVGLPIQSVRRESKNPYAKLAGSDADATDGAIEFMRTYKGDRFFLYVHFMDVHQYMSDEESAIFGTSYSDLYDNSILWTDRQVAAILRALDEQGLREKTLVVIAADHGEAFQEHGNEGHARDLHREVIYTPWIVSLPFSLDHGVVVDAMTENVDVWPTILDLLGAGEMDQADGVSRLPEILVAAGVEGGEPVTPPRPSYAQLDRVWGKANAPSEPLMAVTVPGRRFMRGLDPKPLVALYDTTADPGESKDLLSQGPPVDVREFDALLDAYQAIPEPDWRKNVGHVELDDLQKGQLRAIGYSIE
ncbi:MAG: sulfatase [Myxococcota bacterium]